MRTSFLLKVGAAIAPLLVMLTFAVAPVAQAAGATVVVAATPNPVNCGRYKVAQSTDLGAALAAAKKGRLLICPGTYNLPGGIEVSGASGLTIAQAVKGVRPKIVIDPSATVGLQFTDSSNVTLDGLSFDATASATPDLVMVYFSQSSGRVRNTVLVGSETTATAILVSTIGKKSAPRFTVSGVQARGYGNFGLNVTGPIQLSLTASSFDGTDGGRVPADLSISVVLDGSGDDALQPTGAITRSTFANDAEGIRVWDGSRVTISGSTFTGNDLSVEIQGGLNHALSQNNRIIGNRFNLCNTCIFLDDTATAQEGFKLLNTLVSRNVFRAGDDNDTAVDFRPLEPGLMTGKVSGNTFIGYLNASHQIFNNNDLAVIKIGRNTARP